MNSRNYRTKLTNPDAKQTPQTHLNQRQHPACVCVSVRCMYVAFCVGKITCKIQQETSQSRKNARKDKFDQTGRITNYSNGLHVRFGSMIQKDPMFIDYGDTERVDDER